MLMVDFVLSEEQRMLQQLARDFAEEEVKPNAGKWDSTSEFPRQAIKKANDFHRVWRRGHAGLPPNP